MAGGILGRQVELGRVGMFLDSLPDGPAGCVLEGAAGIGKTALWREGLAGALARSYRVLSCAPAEVEARLSFASLADLLAGIEEEVFVSLPAPQRRALDVALLRADPGGVAADQRAVGTAAVSLLSELSCLGPLVVAVDDVQWLDRPSAGVLEFVARRLEDRPVGFLLSLRTPTDTSAPLGLDRSVAHERLERIAVGPMSVGALYQVMKVRLGLSFSRATLVRIHRATGGNPFFALELAMALLQAGAPAAGEPLPVPDDLRELVAGRLRKLPAATRQTLVFAAAMPDPTVEALRRAVRISAKQMLERLSKAEETGVIAVEGERVGFTHPLYASAIYSMVSADERGRAHRRLASLAADVEQRARHLALCTDGPDSEVARTVAAAAGEVRRRGAPGDAAELAELAIHLTPPNEVDERDRRRLELSNCLIYAGDAERARDVLLAVSTGPGPLCARALLDLAALDYWGESARAAVERCEQALVAASGNPGLEGICHAELAVYCDFDVIRCERHARLALELLSAEGEAADVDALADALLVSARASLLLGRGLPLDVVERAFELESRSPQNMDRTRVGIQLGQWLKYVDDFAGSRSRLEAGLSAAVQEGDESAIPNALMHLAQLECWSGNWPLALRYAEESFDLAEQLGQTFGGPPAYRALVDAHLGNVDRARTTVTERLEVVEQNPVAAPLYLRVLGFLELSLGNTAGAEQHLSRALELIESIGILEPGVFRVHADLVEALVSVGSFDRAEKLLGEFEQRARANRLPWSQATSARCRGLLHAARGDVDAAEHSLEDALRDHERLPMPFERARTLLALGFVQRRKNERRRAHESLEQALAIFEELGAPLWAERTRRELRPVGGRPTDRETLTPAEQRVAELAASGLTNREVAAILFISPKTVEATLVRVYRKLKIHSRAELGAHIGARTEPE
jgi:DNA-binding CsgD family transcriptional regulator/tetratricopeptide (TPR) repeat protein